MYSPGSGIYFFTGLTIAFNEHIDAMRHFNAFGNEKMSAAAAEAGYYSIQFLEHVDHVNYPCDSSNTNRPGLSYMGVEIVAVKRKGMYSCGTSQAAVCDIKNE